LFSKKRRSAKKEVKERGGAREKDEREEIGDDGREIEKK